MRYGGEHPKPNSKKSRRNLESSLLRKRELSLQIQNSHVPIGAVEMVIADSQKGAISRTMGHKVVVRGPRISAKEKEKEMEKETGEEKEKAMEKAKVEEEEVGHRDPLR